MIAARALIPILYLAFFSQLVCAEGEVKGLKKVEYWKNTGKVKQCDVYDVNGYLKVKVYCRFDGTIEKIERFNMIGKRVEEALYDGRGKLKTGIDGWAAIRWIYSGPMLMYEIAYDETGKPMEMKMYSESGKLIARRYRDDVNFNPYEQASMYMMLGGQSAAFYDTTLRKEDESDILEP
ncbi:MAG: hypothetical protein PHV48_06445 [Candidatus Omnitrophica bacterium]|nr:hypothetical protein [Candidatus Omnitrophota bacterium]